MSSPTDTPFRCAICLQQASGPAVVTKCGHLFCWRPCLVEWSRARGHRTVPCPTCNGSVNIDTDLTPIYGSNDDRTQGPPQRSAAASSSSAGSSTGSAPAAAAAGAEPPPQAHRNAAEPPPQAHRNAAPAPPPAGNNGIFGVGGIGFMPLAFFFYSGGSPGGGEYIVPAIIISIGFGALIWAGFQQWRQQRQLGQQADGGGGGGMMLGGLDAFLFDIINHVGGFLRRHATKIAWTVVLITLFVTSDLWSGVESSLWTDGAVPGTSAYRKKYATKKKRDSEHVGSDL